MLADLGIAFSFVVHLTQYIFKALAHERRDCGGGNMDVLSLFVRIQLQPLNT